jgi:hypothetical protein
LNQTIEENSALLEATREFREGPALLLELFQSKAIAPRYKPSSRKISEDAVKLIIAFEVTSQAQYERKYQRPVWPRGQSGVTVGIGYDVGYATREWLHEDWKGVLSEAQLGQLEIACEVTGAPALNFI